MYRTAERARPLDDYNNGVVMTHRPLYDNELFEIRIDRLVDKWSGSIEVTVLINRLLNDYIIKNHFQNNLKFIWRSQSYI